MNSRRETPPKSNSISRSSCVIVELNWSSTGDAAPLDSALSGATSLPRILPSTDSDSDPSSTVVVCLSEEVPSWAPLGRADPLRRETDDPVSLEDTRDVSDPLADRDCEVMYGLPRWLDTRRGRGDMGLLFGLEGDCRLCCAPSRSSHIVAIGGSWSRGQLGSGRRVGGVGRIREIAPQ